jgi:site-specific DNA-cytosine methylase
MLYGFRARKAKHLPVPNRSQKEVVIIVKPGVEADKLNIKAPPRSALEAISVYKVAHKCIIKTSSDPYPRHYSSCPNAPLICRRIFQGELKDGCLMMIRPDEADLATAAYEVASLTQRLKSRLLLGPLSYASGFCGAGGDLTGAHYAGMKTVFGWDNNRDGCATSRANHSTCQIFCKDQDEILLMLRSPNSGLPRPECVCVYHCSFPCQDFSPAKTHRNPDGDFNAYLSLGVAEHLKGVQPMIFTAEQTSGIVTHHPHHMRAFIQNIASRRYNVRWKIHNFHDYGLPSSRKRLILFASREGVPLPPFPEPTHGPGCAYPHRCVHDYIANIPNNATCHLDMAYWYEQRKQPYDPRTKRLNTVMTNGVDSAHPSGARAFTPREISDLQTLPTSYILKGNKTSIVRQVGNCVPPLVWRIFMRSVAKTLQDWAHGRIDAAGRPTGSAFSPIQISDDEEEVDRSRSASSCTLRDEMDIDEEPPLPSFGSVLHPILLE